MQNVTGFHCCTASCVLNGLVDLLGLSTRVAAQEETSCAGGGGLPRLGGAAPTPAQPQPWNGLCEGYSMCLLCSHLVGQRQQLWTKKRSPEAAPINRRCGCPSVAMGSRAIRSAMSQLGVRECCHSMPIYQVHCMGQGEGRLPSPLIYANISPRNLTLQTEVS